MHVYTFQLSFVQSGDNGLGVNKDKTMYTISQNPKSNPKLPPAAMPSKFRTSAFTLVPLLKAKNNLSLMLMLATGATVV